MLLGGNSINIEIIESCDRGEKLSQKIINIIKLNNEKIKITCKDKIDRKSSAIKVLNFEDISENNKDYEKLSKLDPKKSIVLTNDLSEENIQNLLKYTNVILYYDTFQEYILETLKEIDVNEK